MSIQNLISSYAERESQKIFSKFISTSRISQKQATNNMHNYFQQYLDIIIHNDFNGISQAIEFKKINKSH